MSKELEEYYESEFCIEADELYNTLEARLRNRLRQQAEKTKPIVKFPKEVFLEALESQDK